jgi:hypothetical protein
MTDWSKLKEGDPVPVVDNPSNPCFVFSGGLLPYVCCRDKHSDPHHVAWGSKSYIYHTWTD